MAKHCSEKHLFQEQKRSFDGTSDIERLEKSEQFSDNTSETIRQNVKRSEKYKVNKKLKRARKVESDSESSSISSSSSSSSSSSTTSSSTSSSSSSSSDSELDSKKSKTCRKSGTKDSKRKPSEEKRKRLKKRIRKKEELINKRKMTLMNNSKDELEKLDNNCSHEIIGPTLDLSKNKVLPLQRKLLKPMTKEEWDKQQSVLHHVVDPETGRTRLVRGEGEILEEIVTKKRQKGINRAATQGDGIYYQTKLSSLAKFST